MDWSAVFTTVNVVALFAWVALIALPRPPALLSGILFLGVGGLCALYAVLLASVLTGVIPAGGGANFTTIEGVRAIFGSDVGVVIGWTHYLAFDLFVGSVDRPRCGCEVLFAMVAGARTGRHFHCRAGGTDRVVADPRTPCTRQRAVPVA